jgi:undecaprenyl-diphosphatase
MYLPTDMPGLWEFDYETFFAINHGASNSVLDVIAPVLRNKWTWVPLYILAATFIIWKWRMQGALIVATAALTVLLTEVTASTIMKPIFMRPRPCYDPELPGYVNLVVSSCRTSYGFPSAHAANHFGMAFFFTWLWGGKYKWLVPLLMLWALSISLSQVYVGVHYPLDIFGGFVVGTTISLAVWLLYRFQLTRLLRHVRT